MKKFMGTSNIIELFDIKTTGVTEPIDCLMENGVQCIAKYMNNRCGQQVLINELIASKIADNLGLTIPEYGIGYLSETVIENNNTNFEIDSRNAGPCFVSRYYSKTVPLNDAFIRRLEDGYIERLILFDYLLGNHDRHMGNLLFDITSPKELYFIDHSHLWGKELNVTVVSLHEEMHRDKILSNELFNDNKSVYAKLLKSKGFNENELINFATLIRSKVDNQMLNLIEESIPNEWTYSIETDILKNIIKLILTKVDFIYDICDMIDSERRKL